LLSLVTRNFYQLDKQSIDTRNEAAWLNRRKDLRAAFDSGLKLKEASTQMEYRKGLADSSKVLGYCYWRFADYSLSLSHSLDAIKIYQETGDKKGEADTLNSIGAVYMFQKDHQRRLECNMKCYAIRTEIGDLEGAAGSENNIGETYMEMGDMENASAWFDKCLANQISTAQIKAWANHNLGKIHHHYKAWDSAAVSYARTLDLTNEVNYDVLTSETYLQLADLHVHKKEWDLASEYVENALVLSKRIGAKEEQERALRLVAVIQESTGLFEKALGTYKDYHELHAEIFNKDKEDRLRDIEYQYEIDKISKEAEIERLKTVELTAAYNEIEGQKAIVERKNVEVMDSIRYAERIQRALLSDRQYISNTGMDHFILYQPKDIVSGDFYWILEKEYYLYVAAADCTGHGVPGAFLTMLGTSYLNEILSDEEAKTPAKILSELRSKFMLELSEGQ